MHVEGQLASCVNAHLRHNSSIKAVRELLKLTQEKAVARAKQKGETIGRDEWVKVETGTNKGSTARIQKALAAGLDLDVATIEGLLTGKIEPSEAVRRKQALPTEQRAPATGEHLAASSGVSDEARMASLYETALLRSVDHELHTIADLAAAKAALVEAARLTGTQPEPARVARLWLDAARELRLAGQPTTTAAISARIALLQRVA